jgi:hypothetical protein
MGANCSSLISMGIALFYPRYYTYVHRNTNKTIIIIIYNKKKSYLCTILPSGSLLSVLWFRFTSARNLKSTQNKSSKSPSTRVCSQWESRKMTTLQSWIETFGLNGLGRRVPVHVVFEMYQKYCQILCYFLYQLPNDMENRIILEWVSETNHYKFNENCSISSIAEIGLLSFFLILL